jgi:hypothetical protein
MVTMSEFSTTDALVMYIRPFDFSLFNEKRKSQGRRFSKCFVGASREAK